MPKLLILVLAAAIVFAVSGCATTGDPNAGGIFWSESKAKQRQDEMRAALHQEQRRGAELQDEKQRLENEISELQRKIKEMEAAERRLLQSQRDELKRLRQLLEQRNQELSDVTS